MRLTKFLKLKLPEATDQASPEPFNENAEAIEEALATIDNLASVYGYKIQTETSGKQLTTTLTVDASSPIVASRKTVETVNDNNTTYEVTVTIDNIVHSMVHTVAATTGSGVVR